MPELKSIYRIKTKEEFRKEYGSSWRYKIPGSWTSEMDRFFGQIIDEKFMSTIQKIKGYNECGYLWHRGGFGFSLEMAVLLEDTRFIIRPCDCLAGCEKCDYTGEITSIFADSNDQVKI